MGKWYEISLDELMHNENMHKQKVTNPRKKAVMLTEMMLSYVLNRLGVDTKLEADIIKEQQDVLGIDIREMDETQLRMLCMMMKKDFNAKALGFYVYQHNEPVAFISDPYVKQGQVKVSVEPYDTRIAFNEKSMRMETRA
jgi:hypothetical protein